MRDSSLRLSLGRSLLTRRRCICSRVGVDNNLSNPFVSSESLDGNTNGNKNGGSMKIEISEKERKKKNRKNDALKSRETGEIFRV